MKIPDFSFRIAWSAGVLLVLAAAAFAQPIDKPGKGPARIKPQVIYHLPASSAYGERLHSQAKVADSNPAAEASPPATPPSPENPPVTSVTPSRHEAFPPSRERHSKHSKASSSRSMRPQSMKSKGPGNSGRGKSHKK